MKTRFMRFPEGRKKALTLSYDDGVEQDIRLIEIMKKYGLKGTFNLNSGSFVPEGTKYPEGQVHRRMTASQAYEAYAESGNEVAIHGLTHPWLDQLTPDNVVYEILEDRKNLEALFGCEIRGGAYPFGKYSDTIVDALRMCGIAYCRTTKSTGDFSIPTDWLRLPATCHHRNERLFELAHKFVEETTDRTPWLFYLWGHSYEFEGDNNWDRIERFAEATGGRDDIWYATNIEIYDYVMAYNSLRFTVDGTCAINPTATDVWFATNEKEIFVPKGGSAVIE